MNTQQVLRQWLHRRLQICVAGGLLLIGTLPLRVAVAADQVKFAAAEVPLAGVVPRTSLVSQSVGTQLLVVGFMGGHIKAGNMIHQEAQIARDLQRRNAGAVEALTFANHNGDQALHAVTRFLDANHDGMLSGDEKRNARVVIYGHSWGASETVNLARTLGRMGVPVLLTIQVDSIQKMGENDRMIPANVQQAMNFYQDEGLLNGRSTILADDPHRTIILGNQRISYKTSPVNCDHFPWFARTFMKPHIEIENDPHVWNRVEAMIQQQVNDGSVQADGGAATP